MAARPPTRRAFLKALRNVTLATGAASLGGWGYGYTIEPKWVDIERVTLPIPRLPSAFDGFRIAQLSDLHLYPATQLADIRRAVELTNSLRPDLVVLTGDYVLESAEAVFDLAPALAGLNAPHGVYLSLGNHDLWTDVRVVLAGMAESRLPVLVNQAVDLTVGGARVVLAGLDDGWSGQPDLAAALASCPADVPAVLLMHEPDYADEFARDPRLVLQLSGHTHGGQVRLPGIGALLLPRYGRKYDQGLYRVGDMWLYTNRGLGVIEPAIRFNCRPEITELTLVAEG